MKTFKEKLLNSLNDAVKDHELNAEILDFILNKIAEEAVEYDMFKSTDLKARARVITNSFLAKGEEIKL